jgi:hypothetical protein
MKGHPMSLRAMHIAQLALTLGVEVLSLSSSPVVVPRGFWFGLGSELCSSRGYIKVVAV